MNQINLLRQTLKPHLGWHGARLSFLALFLIALLRVKTINLTELYMCKESSIKKEGSILSCREAKFYLSTAEPSRILDSIRKSYLMMITNYSLTSLISILKASFRIIIYS